MNEIFFGDCRDSLRKLAADGVKVQTCVTSPPYFGLRDYGHAGQIGLEETPESYIAELVDVFRCVRDVLADDGTLWVNIGDSYASQGGKQVAQTKHQVEGASDGQNRGEPRRPPDGLKQKDLIGIPWMLAFALRADGWYLRQDIIWAKPNPMPESVTDRCTKAHEYVFLLSKGPRYFYDHEAVKEPVSDSTLRAYGTEGRARSGSSRGTAPDRCDYNPLAKGDTTFGFSADGKRNRRSVWSIATRPYKGAHFAVFPPALVEPCILAGSRPGDIVLDPFMGSGTTAEVATLHGRQFIGCELNTDYKALQDERIAAARLSLAAPPVERRKRPRKPAPAAQSALFGDAA